MKVSSLTLGSVCGNMSVVKPQCREAKTQPAAGSGGCSLELPGYLEASIRTRPWRKSTTLLKMDFRLSFKIARTLKIKRIRMNSFY
jgi:hypothetical protein